MNEKVFRKIIVAIDGSPNSYRAAEVAIEIADIYNSELIVVGVIDISMIADFEMKVGDEHTVQQAEKELKEGTLNNLKRVIDMAKEKKVIANISVRRGRPNLEIVNAANEFRVDLIIMGKGGRRGGSRLQMGNITERVIEDSDVSILVVK